MNVSEEKLKWCFRLFMSFICWFVIAISGKALSISEFVMIPVLALGWLGVFYVLYRWGVAK